MPVTASKQARIDMSAAQFSAIATVVERERANGNKDPMISIEETNISGVVALKTKNLLGLVSHNGDYRDLRRGR